MAVKKKTSTATSKKAAPKKRTTQSRAPATKRAAPKKATTKKASTTPRSRTAATGVSAAQREQMIREAAYYRAEQRGFSGGDPIDDWLRAEAEVEASLKGKGSTRA